MTVGIRRILWPKLKERPKTKYLLRGFTETGLFVKRCGALARKWRLPGNHLGPYIYPIQIDFNVGGKIKTVTVWFDTYPNPDKFFLNLKRPDDFYFKTHIRKKQLSANKRIFVMPNSTSFMHYLDKIEIMRAIAEGKASDEIPAVDFYGVFRNDHESRLAMVKHIVDSGKYTAIVGVHNLNGERVTDEKYFQPRLEYDAHLRVGARARFAIALPGGRAAPYCSFRHVEYWGIGALCFSIPPDCVLVGNPDPHEIMVIVAPDLSDFDDVAEYYLTHDSERRRIAENGREYFDRYLTPRKHAEWIIDHVIEREFA